MYKSALLFLFFSCQIIEAAMIDKTTVKELDISRYLGTWYEIARFPHSFEKGLVGVTATYSMRPDGKIKVLNQGRKNSLDGELSSAVGKAKIPDPSKPGNLKVSFFWIFYAEYNVLELDPEYQYALIGSSNEKYLWILSRNPEMDEKTYQMLVEKARLRGYDVVNFTKYRNSAFRKCFLQ